MAQDGDKDRAFVNMAMNLNVPYTVLEILE
jgi:hypothetical protein